VALQRIGRPKEALAHLQKVPELAVRWENADLGLLEEYTGRALLDLTKPLAAAEHFGRAIELLSASGLTEDHRLELELLQGEALYRGRRFEEARKILEEVANRAPDRASAWLLLGAVSAEQNRIRESVEHFRRALAIEPNNLSARYALAQSLAIDGDESATLDELELIRSMGPDFLVPARNNPAFRRMRENPRFRRVVGLPVR